MRDVICTGCLARGARAEAEAMVCFGCGSVLIHSEPARWVVTSREGKLHLFDRATHAVVMPLANAAFSTELCRLLNLAGDLTRVLAWVNERAARTRCVADLAAMAWLATVDFDHVPFNEAAVLQRFVERTQYLAGVESSESITADVIAPLADDVGVFPAPKG